MCALQRDTHGRLRLHAEFGHAVDERVLEPSDHSFGELARDGLIDLGCSRKQLPVNR